MHDEPYEAVAIGGSAGGLQALKALLGALPASFAAPILIALHRGDTPTHHLATMLAPYTPLRVKNAEEGERPQSGTVYLAPAGRHLELVNGRLSVLRGGRIQFVCPSADVLFESVARCLGARAIAVVLTGLGSDGSAGVRAIRAAGGFVVAQDPASCEYPGMPSCAIETRKVDLVLPLRQLGYALETLVAGALAA